MKITIYELLGLVKDGKAPKKIKYEYSIYELTPERNDYYCKNEMRWFTNEINCLGVLSDYVEIIEEPKKIEKWGEGALEEMEKCTNYTLEDLQKYIRILAETQNELIDEINHLKGND